MGRPELDNWTEIGALNSRSKESTGYPTQKPIALLERIIKASSNKGDFVLDLFCRCATTCVAAERLQRHWIGIDITPKAIELVRVSLEKKLACSEMLSIAPTYRNGVNSSLITAPTNTPCSVNRKDYAMDVELNSRLGI